MDLGELGENGQLKIVQNVNELYEKWNELKEDGMITDSVQANVNNGKIIWCIYMYYMVLK